ncbi:TNR16-like protein [Mya arenaria]|uniref:TNR16-like protein n=1 Tax=Mya arenaria TaxID=6604 RepID=A0ABY7F2X9_MYAAR|nr:TNR16-like protein [Mya arenaria]
MGGELVVCGLMVLGLATQVIWAKFDDTYYIVETNGEYIHCKKCPHGTYWLQNCDRDGGQATCEECPDGRFMEDFNRALYCKKCTECKGNHKESREVVAAECTRFHDTKCQCIEGYWREEGRVGDCRSVSPCKQGYGVKKLATDPNGEFVRVTVEAGNEDNNSEPEVDQELARLAIANDTGLFSDLSLLRISGNIGQWLQLALELGLSNAERERINF